MARPTPSVSCDPPSVSSSTTTRSAGRIWYRRPAHSSATALHVHPNTLYQRLDRITALMGEGWRDGDRALDVHMALRMHDLMESLNPPE